MYVRFHNRKRLTSAADGAIRWPPCPCLRRTRSSKSEIPGHGSRQLSRPLHLGSWARQNLNPLLGKKNKAINSEAFIVQNVSSNFVLAVVLAIKRQ